MERSPQLYVKDKDMYYQLDFIFRNAMGNPIVLAEVPTSAQMKANTWGIIGTDLYIKFGNGTTLKFTGVNVA